MIGLKSSLESQGQPQVLIGLISVDGKDSFVDGEGIVRSYSRFSKENKISAKGVSVADFKTNLS